MAKVLIVDDEPDILLMLRMNLESDGHQTVLAADGEMALRRIDETDPELVLLDVMMPVMDGWGVLERLKTTEVSPPVIVVSAKSSPRDAQRALELGAVDYVTKPFDVSRLLHLVSTTLERSPAERDEKRRTRLNGNGS